MRIEPFDAVTADEATALSYADLEAEGSLGATPDGLRRPPELVLNELRNPAPHRRTYVWIAYDGDTMAGAATLEWTDSPDNRNRAWMHFSLPGAFDEAVAAPLLRAVAEGAVAHERPLLNPEVPAESPYGAWLKSLGGRLGSVEQHNVTRLRSLDRADLAALASATPDGYELFRIDGPVPDDIVEPYIQLVHTMNDAPRDDLTMEDWLPTETELRAFEAGLAAQGHTMWTLVAREVATGELAAFNQLVLRPEWPECVENEDTAVAVKHRGHGIGLWIKAANLLRVVDERPDAVCVETWNAASNEHMLRVNRRLGFVCEHVWESWEIEAPTVL